MLGGRWTAVSGRGGAPAAKRGRTTLRPRRIRRILGWPGEQRQKTLWLKVMRCLLLGSSCTRRCGTCQRPAATAHSFQDVHPRRGGGRRIPGAGGRHQTNPGQGTRATHLRWHLFLCLGERHRQSSITQPGHRVIGTAQHAPHRQGWVLPVAAVALGRKHPVIAVIRRARPDRTLGRLERPRTQLGRALSGQMPW